MDELLSRLLDAPGISGHEAEVARIMETELRKTCEEVSADPFGNVIGRKGSGRKKIMLAAHMDEIGLMVKHVTKEGYLHFIKVGGIDDRILPAQRVIIKAKKGDVAGVIGAKPPHLQKEEERKQPIKHDDMFIDIGAPNREEALSRIDIADPVVFESRAGVLNGKLCVGKAADNRVGCYILIKVMERVNAAAQVYAVATAQEEVGLKGARTSSFRIAPDFAVALDTTVSGDTPGIQEKETSLTLGGGVAVTVIEAAGRGIIVGERVKRTFFEAARERSIKYQIDVVEGGMTDGAMIQLNREGVLTGVLSVPCRYIHSPVSVFNLDDVQSAVELAVAVVEKVAGE